MALQQEAKGKDALNQTNNNSPVEAEKDAAHLLNQGVETIKDYAIFVLDKVGTVLTWNAGAEEIKGYKANEIIGENFSKFYTQEAVQRGLPQYELDMAVKNGWYEDEGWRVRKNGQQFLANVIITAIRNQAGDIIGFSKITQDLLYRRKTEDELQKSLKELASIKHALDVSTIVAITDKQGVITYVNDAFCKISKYPSQDLIGKTHRIINSGYHSQDFFKEMWATIGHGHVWKGEIKNRAKDDTYYWVDTTIVPLLGEEGKPAQYIAIRHDITNRKQIETELRQSLKDLSDIKYALDVSTIVAVTDKLGTITEVNDAFCKISKYAREELIGQNHRIINSGYHSHDFFKEMWATIGHGRVWKNQIKNRAKDGSYYWVDTTIVPFLDADGKPYQYVAIRHDITQQKQAEERLRSLSEELEQRVVQRTAQLQSLNKELETFAYSVSHDLRAPLRSIESFSGFILEEEASHFTEKGKQYFQYITENSQKMDQLIEALLELSRLSRSQLEIKEINLSELAREIVKRLQEQEPARHVAVRIANNLIGKGDRRLLQVALQNLIGNAWKFTEKRPDAQIELDMLQKEGHTIYYIKDNGAGFNMKYAGKLFGAFQRLHKANEFPGTGIGLATVYRIIQRHNGSIWAESEIRNGTTFYFTLEPSKLGGQKKLVSNHEAASSMSHYRHREIKVPSRETQVILVVEDNPFDEALMLRALQQSGFNNKIVVARDGEEALEYVFASEHYGDRPSTEDPVLILLDLKIPKIDGIEILIQMRSQERTKEIPVVVVSSSNREEDITQSYESGADRFIHKQADFVQFVKMLTELKTDYPYASQSSSSSQAES